MRLRRRIGLCLMFSRRFRKIIYVVIVSVLVTLAICNRFGVNVSTNSRNNSKESSDQVLPKSVQLHRRDTRNPKNNRSLKRLSLDERVSNVHYVTIDPVKHTRKMVSSKSIKIESVDVKRKRESYKRAIRSQFQYTRTEMSNRDGLFNTGIGKNNKIQKMQGRPNSQKSYFGKTLAFIKGSIRFYAKPEWFSEDDIESMVTLSAKDIIRVENAKLHSDNNWKDLYISKDSRPKQNKSRNIHVSQQSNEQIFHGLTSHSLSLHEVLAFHLDRVIGLGRALPTVAKRIKRNAAKNLNIPDNSLHSILAIEKVIIQPVAGLIKRDVLACKSIQLSDPVSSKYCGNIDGLEWGKLALFDFLLQIHNRLNKLCCSFKPDRNNKCLNKMETNDCSNPNMEIGTVHKEQNNNQLIFLKNDLNIKSSRSIDYEILQGVRKFPIKAVDIIRKRKLKLMLLQSLFIDKAYWDGVGGRPGVEDMINVIVHRAELFLEFYDTYNKVQ